MRRTTGNVEINRHDRGRSVVHICGWPTKGPPAIAQAPTAMTIFGSGTASQVFFKASSMFFVTGPVMSRPSAWRGDATNWMPKRPRSQPMVPSTLVSASQAPQPPALTWRRRSERPKSLRSFSSRAAARRTCSFAGLAEHEVFAPAHGHAVVAGLRDGALRTDFHAGGAKDAATEIERDGFSVRAGDGLGRTHGHAGVAAVGAFAGIHLERAAVAVGQRGGRAFGIGHRFAAALQAMGNGINDEHGFGAAS